MEKMNLEVIKRHIESCTAEDVARCLEKLIEENGYSIGEGANAEVFSMNHERLGGLCVKRILKNPKFLINDYETEFDIQAEMWDRGMNVPNPIAVVEDKEKRDRYIIMEKIEGNTLALVLEGRTPIPENYDHDKYWAKMKENIDKMHNVSDKSGIRSIHHRDLHDNNIMINEKGDPIIIDFGSAGCSSYSDEDIYREDVIMYDENSNKYIQKTNYPLKNDLIQIKDYKNRMYALQHKKVDNS